MPAPALVLHKVIKRARFTCCSFAASFKSRIEVVASNGQMALSRKLNEKKASRQQFYRGELG
jgi:hypothetical protein